VLELAGHVCEYCGGVATEADHIVPVALTGQTAAPVDGYRASCKSCNARRGVKVRKQIAAARRRHPFFDTGGFG
jgi:5-methylcytosine-specific restriction endonuclease McrA